MRTGLQSSTPRRLVLRLAALLLCTLSVAGLGGVPVHAQANSGRHIHSLVDAINSGDPTRITTQVSADFIVVLPDGTQLSGSGAVQALSTLVTPITVVSLQPQGNGLVYTVLQFGSAAPVWVTFTGGGSHVTSMSIGGPAPTS